MAPPEANCLRDSNLARGMIKLCLVTAAAIYSIICVSLQCTKAGTSEAATLQEIGEMRSTVYPQADTVARVLQTVDEEGQMISNVRTDTTANARFKLAKFYHGNHM